MRIQVQRHRQCSCFEHTRRMRLGLGLRLAKRQYLGIVDCSSRHAARYTRSHVGIAPRVRVMVRVRVIVRVIVRVRVGIKSECVRASSRGS